MENIASPAPGSTTLKLSKERVFTSEKMIAINFNEREKSTRPRGFATKKSFGKYECKRNVEIGKELWRQAPTYSMPAEDS